MPKLSFYILSSENDKQRNFFSCKLIEKAYRNGHFCYVLTESEAQSRMLDNLLWTFRPNSFIPHQIYTGEIPAMTNTVLVGSLLPPKNWQKMVINLSQYILQDLTQTERLLEILDNQPQRKQA